MDDLGWENSPVMMNMPSLWSCQDNYTEDGFMAASNSNLCSYGKVGFAEDALNRPYDSQKDERPRSEYLTPDFCNSLSPLVINASYYENLLGSSLTGKFNCENQTSQLENGNSSLLLSATNSNTDTSVEDDGISLLLSECRDLWNFSSNGADSSGESENKNISKSSPEKKIPKSTKRSFHDHNELEPCSNYFSGQVLHHDVEGGFQLITENNPPKAKKARSERRFPTSSNISFQSSSIASSIDQEPDPEAIAQMKEMIYRAAAFRPVNFGLEAVEKPKRKNVRISNDPQTVAARQRRERISERIRILQKLVPGGSKMDTASMLDEAANYLKFLRSQVKLLESLGHKIDHNGPASNANLAFSPVPFGNNHSYFPMQTHLPLENPGHTQHLHHQS